MLYKKTFLAIGLLLCNNFFLSGTSQHHLQLQSHVAASTQGVSASSELITILQDIASTLSSGSNATALTTILHQLNSGVTTFDIQVFEQALQESLGILASSGGALNAFTIIEYTGILVETVGQIEAARAQTASAVATSTVVTATTH